MYLLLGIDTAHQWCFEAVHVSIYFPLGVKTTNRKWRSDQVFELIKKTSGFLSEMGRVIGLDPDIVISEWCPSKTGDNSIKDREGIEG
jgi:hypothetical protein